MSRKTRFAKNRVIFTENNHREIAFTKKKKRTPSCVIISLYCCYSQLHICMSMREREREQHHCPHGDAIKTKCNGSLDCPVIMGFLLATILTYLLCNILIWYFFLTEKNTINLNNLFNLIQRISQPICSMAIQTQRAAFQRSFATMALNCNSTEFATAQPTVQTPRTRVPSSVIVSCKL